MKKQICGFTVAVTSIPKRDGGSFIKGEVYKSRDWNGKEIKSFECAEWEMFECLTAVQEMLKMMTEEKHKPAGELKSDDNAVDFADSEIPF